MKLADALELAKGADLFMSLSNAGGILLVAGDREENPVHTFPIGHAKGEEKLNPQALMVLAAAASVTEQLGHHPTTAALAASIVQLLGEIEGQSG